MTDNKISDEALENVTGGWGAVWSDADEKKLRDEFSAANPDNPSPTTSDLEMFLEAKGLREKVDDNLVYSTIVARINYLTMNGA